MLGMPQNAAPGMGATIFTQANQFLWGGSRAQILELSTYYVDPTAVDAGSNNTKILRQGLAMGKVTATGMLKQFDNAAVDGTQNLVGFLRDEISLIDTVGRTDARGSIANLIVVAPVKASKILILGVTLIGIASEAAIRTKIRARFILDDEI